MVHARGVQKTPDAEATPFGIFPLNRTGGDAGGRARSC